MRQATILEAIEEANKGLTRAVENAERVNEGWTEQCYDLFKEFIALRGRGQTFQVEDFREYCRDDLPTPPSLRSFGYVVKRGKKEGLIESLGFKHKTSL